MSIPDSQLDINTVSSLTETSNISKEDAAKIVLAVRTNLPKERAEALLNAIIAKDFELMREGFLLISQIMPQNNL